MNSIVLLILLVSGMTCGPNHEGKEIIVGFDYTNHDFAPVFMVCFDQAKANTIYAVHKITNDTANRDKNDDRPSWKYELEMRM